MERMLQKSGYEVVTADNGQEAARILSRVGGPRLALIDWMMPGLDGPNVCRVIRDRHDDSYVYMVLLTSKQSSGDVVQGLEAGADDYLTKPCHPAELRARLHTGRRVLQLEDKLVEAREKMRFKATHDSLTLLWDRGGILSLLQSELSRSAREYSPVSLLLCDVDHFKRVNDTYGHQVGDEVLQEVSKRLKDAVRSHDAVGRYGGEEFLIVMGATGTIELQERAEQIRSAISCLPFLTAYGMLEISISIGAITIEGWNKSVSIEPFLKDVDDALYRAKAAGRDRVIYTVASTAA
ncbi:MAG: Response regulator receiver modulated diguanylate cyclase [Acidobacteriaceae bacterium]|nr:Response regulator receiver modulated diguanylate cyclase [Acidobacteriaceae bacterium]